MGPLRLSEAIAFPDTVLGRMMLGMVVAGDLSDAERRVWDAFPTGKLVDFGTGDAEDDDPAGGACWGPDRPVRAEVLATLLCGAVEVEPGQVGKVVIGRVRIIGKLNLPEATLKHPLLLGECYVPDGIYLSRATTRSLVLQGCHVGAIALYGAKINGLFGLSGAHLDGRGGPALDAALLTVTESIFCDEGFQADGEINLVGANIGGELSLRGAHLDGKGGRALVAQDLTVTASMNCDEGFQADGEVILTGAGISGRLNLSGAGDQYRGGRPGAACPPTGPTDGST